MADRLGPRIADRDISLRLGSELDSIWLLPREYDEGCWVASPCRDLTDIHTVFASLDVAGVYISHTGAPWTMQVGSSSSIEPMLSLSQFLCDKIAARVPEFRS